jgi:hypothetical protein
MACEILIAHTQPLRQATAVRSTLLQSSLAFLRDRGHYARYLELVDPAMRERIVASIAPEWLPIELACQAHSVVAASSCPNLQRTASL